MESEAGVRDEIREELIEVLGICHRLFEDISAEAVFEGVQDDDGLALLSTWSSRRLRVAPVGIDLRLKSHISSFRFQFARRFQEIRGGKKMERNPANSWE